jgi:hypothetical protein
MNFQDLLAKMQAIDTADNAPVETQTTECGDTMAPESPMMAPTMPPKEKEEATMNVNITAKGDAIDDVLKLMTKVNPDMINQPEPPTMTIMSPGMDGPMGDMDGPEGPPMPKPINKLLPDFDGDNDDMPGGEKDSMDLPKDHDKDHVMIKALDKDGDNDHDMDDHDMEKDDDKEDKKDKEEAYANEPDEDERDIDYMTNKMSGGMNRRKGTHPKVAGADNPMQRVKEGEDLRASIRNQLLQALEETKGAK